MLQILRDRAGSWIIRTVLILVALTFVFWGTSSIFGLWVDPESVATINGRDIPVSYFQNVLDDERENLLTEQEIERGPAQIDERKLQEKVLSQLINRTLVINAARKEEITLNLAQIDQIIVNQPAFHEDGKFDEKRYLSSLRRSNFSPQSYKEYLQEVFEHDTYIAATQDAVFYTSKMLDEYVDWQFHIRSYDYLELSPQQFVKKDEPVTDEQMRGFYEENVESYYQPEYFRIRSVHIKRENALSQVSPREGDIKSAYEENYGYLFETQEVTLRHIFFEDSLRSDETLITKMEGLKEQIKTKEDFVNLVSNASEDAATNNQGGSLGTNPLGELPPEFFNAIRYTPQDVSLIGPLRTSFGVHLLWIDNRTIVDIPSYEEVYDNLVQDYIYANVDEHILTLGETLSDDLFVLSSIDEAANNSGLAVQKWDLLPLDSMEFRELGKEFLDELLIMNIEDISPVLWLDDGSLMVFELVENVPSRLIPYDEVAERIRTDYQLDQAEKALDALMQDLLEELKKSQDAEARNNIAARVNAEWREEKNISRSDLQRDEIGNHVLSLSAGDLPYGAYKRLAGGNYVLFLLHGITHRKYSDLEPLRRRTVEEAFLQEKKSNAHQWLLTNLNEQAEIEINTEIWDSL